MAEPEIIQECRKIWVINNQARVSIDKFKRLNEAYDEVLRDMLIAVDAYKKGKFKTNKIVKEYYNEAIRILIKMREIAEEINNKKLIMFVLQEQGSLIQNYKKYT